jgi:hypothetical protein
MSSKGDLTKKRKTVKQIKDKESASKPNGSNTGKDAFHTPQVDPDREQRMAESLEKMIMEAFEAGKRSQHHYVRGKEFSKKQLLEWSRTGRADGSRRKLFDSFLTELSMLVTVQMGKLDMDEHGESEAKEEYFHFLYDLCASGIGVFVALSLERVLQSLMPGGEDQVPQMLPKFKQ